MNTRRWSLLTLAIVVVVFIAVALSTDVLTGESAQLTGSDHFGGSDLQQRPLLGSPASLASTSEPIRRQDPAAESAGHRDTEMEFQFRVRAGEGGEEGVTYTPAPDGVALVSIAAPVRGDVRILSTDGVGRLKLGPDELPVAWLDLVTAAPEEIELSPRGEYRSTDGGTVFNIVAVTRAAAGYRFFLDLEPLENWFLEVRSSVGVDLVDSQVAVFIGAASNWLAPALIEPPEYATDCALDVNGGRVTIPAPDNPNAIYWIGAPDHVWFPFRWSRRAEIGHLIELEAPAWLAIDASEELASVQCVVGLYHPSRMWGQRPLIKRDIVIGESGRVAIPPGHFVATVRRRPASSANRTAMAWAKEITVAAGETAVLSLWDPSPNPSITVTVLAESSRLGFDWALWGFGDGTPGRWRHVVKGAADDQTNGGIRTISWPSLQPGFYAVQIDAWACLAFRVAPNESAQVFSFDLLEIESIDVYLPLRADMATTRVSEEAVDPIWSSVSIVLGVTDQSPGFPYPLSDQIASVARIVQFDAPIGAKIGVSYQDAYGVEGTEFWVSGSGYHEAELRPRAMVTWGEDDPRPPLGWVSAVKFERRDGTLSPAPPIFYGDTHGIRTIGVDDPEACRILIPAYAENQAVGGWYDLPPAPSATPFRELDT